jgi:hypothetical protein
MLVDLAQPSHAQAIPELMHHPHVRNPALATQSGELPPSTLLGQHFDQ